MKKNKVNLPVRSEVPDLTAYMIVPPDGGYGWVIVLITFFSWVILDGTSFSFAFFREPMSESLSVNSTLIAMLSSIFIGMYFIASIISCAIANRYGFRTVMLIGSVVLTLSFVTTGFMTNIYPMYVVYGFIGGVGAGFVSISILLPTGFYFDKKRPIAMGLSSSGTGMGAVCMPPLMEYCVTTYGWRNSLFITGGFMSFLIVFAILLRPLKPVKVDLNVNERNLDKDSLLETFMFSTMPDVFSMRSVTTKVSGLAKDTMPNLSSLANRGSITINDVHPEVMQRLQEITSPRRRRSSDNSRAIHNYYSNLVHARIAQSPPLPRPKQGLFRRMFKRKEGDNVGARPLYRTDILYQGSLLRLDEFVAKDRDLDYHMEVTLPATNNDISEERQRKCILCPEAIRRAFSTLFNCKLLKSPTYLCLTVSAVLIYFSFYIPFLYVGKKMEAEGMSQYSSLSVSVIGVGLMLGRILCGVAVTIFPNLSAYVCSIITCGIAGLTCFIITLKNEIVFELACMGVYGFTAGAFSPLRSIIIVDFMGLENLTSATGMIIFFQGVGSLLGPPCADLIARETNNNDMPFYLAGSTLLIGGLLLIPLKWIHIWEMNHQLHVRISI